MRTIGYLSHVGAYWLNAGPYEGQSERVAIAAMVLLALDATGNLLEFARPALGELLENEWVGQYARRDFENAVRRAQEVRTDGLLDSVEMQVTDG